MSVTQEITKEVFEKYVPAAKTPANDTSVYSRMVEPMRRAYSSIVREMIGAGLVSRAEEDQETRGIISDLVANTAFAQTARSLDLVVTATGFGVVSTESTAPASKSRVDSLLAEVRLKEYELRESLTDKLVGIEGWGDSPLSHRVIDTLFWRISHMRELTTLEYSADRWLWASAQAVDADRLLRRETGDELMDHLIDLERHGTLDGHHLCVAGLVVRLMGRLISDAETHTPPQRGMFDQLLRYIEDHADEIETYKNSKIYQARHHEGVKNTGEDSSFFFM